MKRKNNLYKDIYKFENILYCFNEVCKNTKNKRKVEEFKSYKSIYISRCYNELKNKKYEMGKFHIFYIKDPKERRIVSLNMYDKLINHLVSKYILYPSIIPCLIDSNCASRPNKGVKYALDLYYKYRRILDKKNKDYYILKCDIKSYFSSINIDILKRKIKTRIKDIDSLNIINKILDSDDVLSIGFMSSQILGIFYLNDLDHYIKEKLKIRYYVRYQDDFLLLHEDKNYLKYCYTKISKFLEKEKLQLNKKTRIYKNTNNFIFLGRNKYGKYAKYRSVNRKIKHNNYLYNIGKINFNNYISSYICYKNISY